MLAGATLGVGSDADMAVAIVPGGGVDVPVPGKRFSIRLQGDLFMLGLRGGIWRLSTGWCFIRANDRARVVTATCQGLGRRDWG